MFIFPALLATGLSPVVATAVCTTALTPGLFLAGSTTARSCRRSIARCSAMIVVSIAGGLAGAALLLLTPERMFAALVPLLLGFATVLFAYAGPYQRLAARARGAPGGGQRPTAPFARRAGGRSRSMAAISAPASAC